MSRLSRPGRDIAMRLGPSGGSARGAARRRLGRPIRLLPLRYSPCPSAACAGHDAGPSSLSIGSNSLSTKPRGEVQGFSRAELAGRYVAEDANQGQQQGQGREGDARGARGPGRASVLPARHCRLRAAWPPGLDLERKPPCRPVFHRSILRTVAS